MKITKWCSRNKYHWDDRISVAFQQISPWSWRFMALYFALGILDLPEWFVIGKNIGLIFILAIEGTKFLQNILTLALLDAENTDNRTAIQGLLLIGKVILWSTILILLLSNLGFNVNTLVASLGIGGIAVALASQNFLSDLFASFSIYIDRPFQIGDYIEVGNESGEVEQIGLKTTRIKTLHGEELVYSNKVLVEDRIHNYKKMKTRRVDITFHFDPSNSSENLDKVSTIAKEVISKTEGTIFNYTGILEITEWSFKCSVSYYMENPDWNIYVENKEQTLLNLKKRFEEEKIKMIFSKIPFKYT